MSNTVTIRKGDVVEVYEDVLGHQVGNGAIQILMMNGNNRIIFSPDDIDVTLDEAGNQKFMEEYASKVREAELQAAAAEKMNTKDARPVEVQVKGTGPKLVS